MKNKFQINVKCSTDLKDTEGFSVDGNLIIDDIIDKFGVKCVEFECIKKDKDLSTLANVLKTAADNDTKKNH